MLTKKDLMKRYGVASRTIDYWKKKKQLPFCKQEVNGRVFYDESEIEEWEKKMFVKISKND